MNFPESAMAFVSIHLSTVCHIPETRDSTALLRESQISKLCALITFIQTIQIVGMMPVSLSCSWYDACQFVIYHITLHKAMMMTTQKKKKNQ